MNPTKNTPDPIIGGPKIVDKIVIVKSGVINPDVRIVVEDNIPNSPITFNNWTSPPGQHVLTGPNAITIVTENPIGDKLTVISGDINLKPPFDPAPIAGTKLIYHVNVYIDVNGTPCLAGDQVEVCIEFK